MNVELLFLPLNYRRCMPWSGQPPKWSKFRLIISSKEGSNLCIRKAGQQLNPVYHLWCGWQLAVGGSIHINCFVLHHGILCDFFHECRMLKLASVWHSQTVLHSKAKFVLTDGRPVQASGVIQTKYNSNLGHFDGKILFYLFIYLQKNSNWVTWTM